MNETKLILPRKLLIGFSGIGIAMIIGLFYNAYSGIAVDMNWLYVSIILNFIAFFAVLMDLIKYDKPKKYFWLFSLIILPFISTFVYLIVVSNAENPETK